MVDPDVYEWIDEAAEMLAFAMHHSDARLDTMWKNKVERLLSSVPIRPLGEE